MRIASVNCSYINNGTNQKHFGAKVPPDSDVVKKAINDHVIILSEAELQRLFRRKTNVNGPLEPGEWRNTHFNDDGSATVTRGCGSEEDWW